MEIKTINGHTRILGAPSNWDQSKGECVGLPIMDQETENGLCMISEWQPEPDDLKLLNMGMPLHLWVYGDTHPVVSISVGQPTQEAIDKAALEAPFNPDWDLKKAHRESMIEAGIIIGNLQEEVRTLTAELDELKSATILDKPIAKLTMTLHANTAHLRKTLADLIACDAYAITFQTMAQYRTALMKEIEKALAYNINIDHDVALMPRSLTAENGAKAALMGEFHEVIELTCRECDEDDEECEFCNRTGQLLQKVPVDWTTIKAIYKKAVEVCEVKNLP